jgi:hypothetical protein
LSQLLEALGIKNQRQTNKTVASPPPLSHRNDELALPPEHFEEWFIDRLEEGNPVRLQRYFWNWREAVRAMQTEPSPEAIPAKQLGMTTTDQQLLDYIAIAGNVAIRFAQKDQFNLIANLLYDAYSTVNRWGTSDGTTSADWNVRPSEARCCVLDLVFSLGAAAMDAEKYDFLAPLLNRTTPDRYWEHRSWFRYALTMAARGEPQRGSKWYVPTGRARDYIASRDILLKYFVSVDQVLDRACQFDLVQCLYWVFRSGLSDGLNDSYPSCALSAPVHVASLVRMLIAREGPAGIVGEYSDPQLADTIIAFTKIARDTAGLMAYAGWADEGWDDPVIQEFLKRSRAAAQ